MAKATHRLTRVERKAQTRTAILEAAAEVFLERGYRAATVEDIAQAAGFTIGALYANFSSKSELLLELFERHNERLTNEIARAVEAGASPEEQLDQAASRWMRFIADEPAWYALLIDFWTLAMRDAGLRAQYAQRFEIIRHAIGALIQQRAAEAGLTLPLARRELGAVAIGLADGLALQKIANRDAFDDDLLARVLMLLLRSSSTARPAARRPKD